jgi:hypothetical protein
MSAAKKRCRICKKSWAAKHRSECKACRRRIEQAQRDAEPRRVCSVCGREKPITCFYKWNDRGEPRLSRPCKSCKRRKVRERYQAILADPYLTKRERERERNLSPEALQRQHERNAERCRRYREKLKRERPEVYQQQLEDARIRAHLRGEERGTLTGHTRAVVVEPVTAPLPIEPLIGFIARAADEEEVISESMQRTIYRVTHEQEAVSMVVADRIITQLGGSLAIVYPELYA